MKGLYKNVVVRALVIIISLSAKMVLADDMRSKINSTEIVEQYMVFIDTEYNWNLGLSELKNSAPQNINPAKIDEYFAKYLDYRIAKPLLIKEFSSLYSESELSDFNVFISSPTGVRFLENSKNLNPSKLHSDNSYTREIFGLTAKDKSNLDAFYASSTWKKLELKRGKMNEKTQEVLNDLQNESSEAFKKLISN